MDFVSHELKLAGSSACARRCVGQQEGAQGRAPEHAAALQWGSGRWLCSSGGPPALRELGNTFHIPQACTTTVWVGTGILSAGDIFIYLRMVL